MITNYQILADSSCDLPFSLARSLGVSYAPLRVQFQGAEYENFLDGDPRSRLDIKAFYSALRTGTPTSTTAVNPEGWSALMTPVLEAGQDILVLAFSSGLQLYLCCCRLGCPGVGEPVPRPDHSRGGYPLRFHGTGTPDLSCCAAPTGRGKPGAGNGFCGGQ